MHALLRVTRSGRVVLTLVMPSRAGPGALVSVGTRQDGSASLSLLLLVERQPRQRRAAVGAEVAAAAAARAAPTVCFDLSYGELMTPEEKGALAKQLALCYGDNRRSAKPFQLAFAGLVRARSTGLLEPLVPWGWDRWAVVREELPACASYAGRRLVYLTSDSDHELDGVDSGAVYVVGGLVDHKCKVGAALRAAEEQGARTARLPLERYVSLRKPALTCQAVVQILAGFHATSDWGRAVREAPAMRCAPMRKYVHWR